MRRIYGDRRAAALMVAIGVLSVLTILVMGLAASQSQVRNNSVRLRLKLDLLANGRACADAALARLVGGGGGFSGKFETDMSDVSGVRSPRVLASYAVRPVGAEDAVYGQSGFLTARAGDSLATVTVRGRRARQVWQMEQVYLLNATSGAERRILLKQSLSEGLGGASK